MCVCTIERACLKKGRKIYIDTRSARETYERVEARVCGRWINLSRGWSINVCERDTSRGCESESFVCVREKIVGRGVESGSRVCV